MADATSPMLAALKTTLLVAAVVNVAVGAVGGGLWWRVDPRPGWWPALRVAQATAALAAVVAGLAYVAGTRPVGLFWLYVLLPLAVSFVAEQLRILSAQTVLDARGIPDAQALGAQPDERQRSVVRAILRREMGVMALAALAVCFLLVRAYAVLS